jgi:hypothetical protein
LAPLCHHGYARRPNDLTWILTINGALLSTDVAKRVVIIKVARAEYSPEWEEGLLRFIEKKRWQILADCIEFLKRDPVRLDI